MKVVEVEWIDACYNSGYLNKKNYKSEHYPIIGKTVGHLFNEDKVAVILVAETFADGESRHIHTIPRGMIKKITTLRE